MKTKLLHLLAACILSGCASVSVTGYEENSSLAPDRMPTKTLVMPVKAVFAENCKGQPAETIYLDPISRHSISAITAPALPKTGKALAKETEKQMARFLGKWKGQKGQELVIESRITTHQRGSRALRALIGLGCGKTLMETKTVVFNPSKSKTEPWMEIWTTGSSNREPGAIFMAMPSPLLVFNILAAAQTSVALANGSGKGLTQDAKRSGKLIGSFVLNRMDTSGLHVVRPPRVKYLHNVSIPLTSQTMDVPFSNPTPKPEDLKIEMCSDGMTSDLQPQRGSLATKRNHHPRKQTNKRTCQIEPAWSPQRVAATR